jgi:hypothetical protein
MESGGHNEEDLPRVFLRLKVGDLEFPRVGIRGGDQILNEVVGSRHLGVTGQFPEARQLTQALPTGDGIEPYP